MVPSTLCSGPQCLTTGILASVSLRGPHPDTGLQGVRKQARRCGPSTVLGSPGFLQQGPYLKQWAAVRIHWGPRMLPPQTCCLLYWRLTCQGQESTEASSPPTTRGAFRLLPQAGLHRKEGKRGSQAVGEWAASSDGPRCTLSRALRTGTRRVGRTRTIPNYSWGDIECSRPQAFPQIALSFCLTLGVFRSLYCELGCVHCAGNLRPSN